MRRRRAARTVRGGSVKQLTAENWLEVDPVIASGVFVQMSLADGSVAPVTAQHWTNRLLAINLSAAVPDAVRTQVEIARGAMIYGSLFYPLFTLGLEQLFRITESAARLKAVELGVSKDRPYHAILTDLHAVGALTDAEHREWTNVRRFRNATTHAEQAMILTPGAALGMFATIVGSINRLFAGSI